MLSYMARRLLLAVFTVWVISILSFFIIQLPEGDTATRHMDKLITFGDAVSMQMVDNLRAYLGLDKPLYQQYGI